MKTITDPHLIYTVADSKKNKIEWIKYTADSEWIYFGETGNVKRSLVIDTINTHFIDEILYIITTRIGSRQVKKHKIDEHIFSLLCVDNFIIWDTEFKQVVEFNRIGTMRCGQSLS